MVTCVHRGHGDHLSSLHRVGRESTGPQLCPNHVDCSGRGRSVLDWSPPGRFRCGHQRKEEWAFRPNPQMSTTATTRGQTRSPVKSPGLGPQFPGVGSRFRHRVSTSPVSLSLCVPIWGMGAAAQCCRPDQGANTLPRGQASPAGVPALGWGAKSGLWTVP